MRIKILAGIYILLLAVLVYLANGSETAKLFRFIRSLPMGDKIGHFFLMGMLSFLLNLALGGRKIELWGIGIPLGTLIALVVVTIEEISQIFVRSRSFDLIDLLFDFAGIVLLGQLAVWLATRRKV